VVAGWRREGGGERTCGAAMEVETMGERAREATGINQKSHGID
jgi:hypothetical protein